MANDLSAFVPVTLMLASTYVLHSTLLLGGTWLFVRLGHVRSETLKERLWKLAAVLGLITAPSQLILGISPATFALTYHETRREDAIVIAADPPSNEIPPPVAAPLPEITPTPIRKAATERAKSSSSRIGDVAVSPSVDDRRSVVVETSDVPPSFQTTRIHGGPVLDWIARVLVATFCVGLFRLCLQSILFSLRLRDCVDVREPSICRMLDEIARRGRVRRRFRLLVSPTFGQPAAFGLFRWTIVLPEDAVRTFEPNELYALLSHEAAHLVRGDAAWLWAGRILCSCFPVQPLNFVARREWRRSSEILCDEWAVQHSANALALARCLTRVAELSSFATPPLQALWALGHRSHLSQRVERLVNGERTQDAWHTRARSRILTFIALGIAAIFVCAAPRTTVFAERDEPPAEKLDPSDISPLPLRRGMFQPNGRLSSVPQIPGEAEHEVRSALSQATTFDCDKLPLHDFLDRIFKNSTLKLDGTFLKGRVDTSLPVTVHVHGTPLLSALDSGFGQLNLDYGFEVHTDKNGTRSRRLIITHAEPDPMVLRTYGIASADESEFKSLEARIKSKIEPESWGEAKGQAQLASDEKHRRMIVRQTPRAHDQIKSMLGNLGKLSPLYITVRTAVVSEDLLRRAGIEPQTARGPGHTVINLSEAQYKDLVIDAVETDEWAFSLRPRVCVTVGQEASIAPYSESASVWPQAIRVHTALVDGRPSISFEMTGIDPITAQSLTESATNPEFKPLLIEMRQKSWRETMRHTISKTKPTSNGTLIEVNRVSSKNSPAPRRFILVKPELGPMTATVRSGGR